MSTGTNKERLATNNGIITDNNADLNALKTRINNLPTSGDTTATAGDILQGKTAVSKGVKLTGTLGTEVKTVKSTTSSQTVAPTAGKLINEITVSPIDLETKTVTPTTSSQTITPSVNKDGISEVTVNAVTSSIDNNIVAGNIKKDVSILGVTGTYEGTKAVLPDGIRFSNSSASNMDFLNNVDSSNVTNTLYMFSSCSKLTTIPQLDTSNVTNMSYMFNNCKNLTTIPQLDTSNVDSMNNMFASCASLSNESLNNILAMCANATAYIQLGTNMTLKYIGLSQTQAETCQTLSNWNDFVAAGWSSGY